MTFVIDPINPSDDPAFKSIQDSGKIALTKEQINTNPLFISAENYILAQVPEVRLPDGRSYAQRDLVVTALELLTLSYFLMGGEIASIPNTAESITTNILGQSETTRFPRGVSPESMASWLKTQADEMISLAMGGTIVPEEDDSVVVLTESKV